MSAQYPRNRSAGEAGHCHLGTMNQLVRFIPVNVTSFSNGNLERNYDPAGYSAQPNSLPPRHWEVGGGGRDGQDFCRTTQQLQGKLLGLTGEARVGAESDLLFFIYGRQRQGKADALMKGSLG